MRLCSRSCRAVPSDIVSISAAVGRSGRFDADLMTNKSGELAELFDYCGFKTSVLATFYGYVRGLARGYKVAIT
nr:hypothetical protein RKHAN_02533 [Rhizobium sp. Khangiran2]